MHSNPKLTHKEHAARAMLMGRIYDWRDGTYCLQNTKGSGLAVDGMIDAMTLEPISIGDAHARESAWDTTSYTYTDPPRPTPYGEGEL